MTESLLCRDRLFTGQVQVRIRLCVEQGGEELRKPTDVLRRNWLVNRRGFDRTRQEYGPRGVLKNTREVIHQSICTFPPDVDDPQGNLGSMMGRRIKRGRTFTAKGPYFEWVWTIARAVKDIGSSEGPDVSYCRQGVCVND